MGQAVIDLANKLSNYNHLTGLNLLDALMPGDTTLYRVAGDIPEVAAFVGLGKYSYVLAAGDPDSSLWDQVTFLDNFFVNNGQPVANVTGWGRTVHEFAHVIDFNHGGNFTFDLANNGVAAFNTGGYGATNRFEYYAESVGIWVYGAPFANEIGAAGALPPAFSDFLQRQLIGP